MNAGRDLELKDAITREKRVSRPSKEISRIKSRFVKFFLSTFPVLTQIQGNCAWTNSVSVAFIYFESFFFYFRKIHSNSHNNCLNKYIDIVVWLHVFVFRTKNVFISIIVLIKRENTLWDSGQCRKTWNSIKQL